MHSLTYEAVSHRFGTLLALSDFSLRVASGSVVCLLGPSGCGKTTALRLAAGLERLQQGSIAIGHETMAEPGRSVVPEERGVGLVFQDFALFPHLSVLQNVCFGLHREDRDRRAAKAMEALERVGMAEQASAYPHTLSGGQQQRVALARAMAPNPRVLLLDEPFSGLDTRLRDKVRDQTLHVIKEAGTTALLVTHDPEEAMFMADEIALMNAGRIAQLGEPLDLYAKPASAFVARFFGETNRLEGRVAAGQVETALGPFEAAGFDEGEAVEVLIRPEALSLRLGVAATSGSGAAHVLAARVLGRSTLIHLCLQNGSGDVHLHARVPGYLLPQENETCAIQCNPSQAYVFPRSSEA